MICWPSSSSRNIVLAQQRVCNFRWRHNWHRLHTTPHLCQPSPSFAAISLPPSFFLLLYSWGHSSCKVATRQSAAQAKWLMGQRGEWQERGSRERGGRRRPGKTAALGHSARATGNMQNSQFAMPDDSPCRHSVDCRGLACLACLSAPLYSPLPSTLLFPLLSSSLCFAWAFIRFDVRLFLWPNCVLLLLLPV